jgi:hypothetical protein
MPPPVENHHVRRSAPSALLVVLCGLGTTFVALLIVYILNRVAPDFNIMGWYVNYVLNIGALLVGIAAGSGYGIASWRSGMRITRRILWLMLALQGLAYFAAQYIEFKQLDLVNKKTGEPAGFFEYFDYQARSFAWQNKDGGTATPMGAFGYFFRALEILGFAAGSLVIPGIMHSHPYCKGCQRYMRKRELALIPASIPVKKFKARDTEASAAHMAEQEKALQDGKAILASLQTLATASKASEFEQVINELKPRRKSAVAAPVRFIVELVHCPDCKSGRLQAGALSGPPGHAPTRAELPPTEVAEDFVRTLRSA